MRHYDPHRHALTPRLWPLVVSIAAVSFALSFVVLPTVEPVKLRLVVLLALSAGGAVLAFGAIVGRWRLWERRHPLRPCGPHCWMLVARELQSEAERQREVARWQ